jgi:hypothetical protein
LLQKAYKLGCRGVFNGLKRMSMNLGLNRVQEVLVVGLMLVLVFAMFSNMGLMDKISIGVLVFALIFLTTMATQLLNQAKEAAKLHS